MKKCVPLIFGVAAAFLLAWIVLAGMNFRVSWPVETINAQGMWQTAGSAELFGALDVLVSILGFAAVIVSLWMYQADSKLQKVKDRFFQLLEAWHAMSREVEYRDLRGNSALCRMENDLLGEVDEYGKPKVEDQYRGYLGRERSDWQETRPKPLKEEVVRNGVHLSVAIRNPRSCFEREDKLEAPG